MKRSVQIIITFLTISLFFIAGGTVMAGDEYSGCDDPKLSEGEKVYCKAILAAEGAGYESTEKYTLSEAIGSVIQGALLVVGSLFMALIVYAGYLWLTAQGDSEQAKKARDIIITATLGLVIVFFAYAISYFILHWAVAAGGYVIN